MRSDKVRIRNYCLITFILHFDFLNNFFRILETKFIYIFDVRGGITKPINKLQLEKYKGNVSFSNFNLVDDVPCKKSYVDMT
jgi:hypothetical protein